MVAFVQILLESLQCSKTFLSVDGVRLVAPHAEVVEGSLTLFDVFLANRRDEYIYFAYSWSVSTSSTRPNFERRRRRRTSTTPTETRTGDESEARPRQTSKPKFRRSGRVLRSSPKNETNWPLKSNVSGIRRRSMKIKKGN